MELISNIIGFIICLLPFYLVYKFLTRKKKKATPSPSLTTGTLFPIVSWEKHHDEISKLLHELESKGKLNEKNYISCKIEPEPSNIHDKNALKVLGYGTKWHFIGYVPSDETAHIRKLMKIVDSGSHYFRIILYYNNIQGARFELALYENKK